MYTVRGKLHWIGVMCDWGWEGESDQVYQWLHPVLIVSVLLG